MDHEPKETIDAAAEIADRRQAKLEGERPAFADSIHEPRLAKGVKPLLLIGLISSLAITTFFGWKVWRRDQMAPVKAAVSAVGNVLPALKIIDPIPLPVTASSPAPEVRPAEPINNEPIINRQEILLQRRLAPSLTSSQEGTPDHQGAVQLSAAEPNATSERGELQNKLQPLRLDPSVAGQLHNPNYLLTQGTMIDCQLETKLITTQPGMAACYTTRNTYSTNGRVILIDRGSKIVGHYQGGMQQGQARIFVLWSRLETPNGVIVNLDSPGSGALGESGLGGTVDTHFWQRFGGSILMSLIGDFGQYAASKSNQRSDTSIQFNNTTQGMQQAAVEALKNSINIPPTLYKNQGERIAIFVARDLDFTTVYSLKPE